MAVRLAVPLRVRGTSKGYKIVLGPETTQMGSSATEGGLDYRFRCRARSLGTGSYPNPMLLIYPPPRTDSCRAAPSPVFRFVEESLQS